VTGVLAPALARRSRAVRSGPIDDLFALTAGRQDLVSFAAGAPDADALPVDLVLPATQRALARWGPAALQYGSTQGLLPLREACLPVLAARGIQVSTDEVHVATGAAGGLNNLGMALLDEGDTVVVERPTYGPAVKVFRSYGADVVDVACDHAGLIPEALDAMLSTRPVKAVYLLPTFQNPTGRTMSAQRRAAVADLLVRHGVLAIEDDVYSDLRFGGSPVDALWSHAPDQVVYLTSLSKTLAPALRTGIMVVPPRLAEAVLALKQGIDMQTSSFTQAVTTELLRAPRLAAHVGATVDLYRRKRDALVNVLTAGLFGEFTWRVPDGGLFLWLQGPRAFDADALLPTALDAGVAYLPGSAFHVTPEDGRNTLRLSYASPALPDVERGAARLAACLRQHA